MSNSVDLISQVGTCSFELIGCWSRRCLRADIANVSIFAAARSGNKTTYPTVLRAVSILLHRHRGCLSSTPYYIFKVPLTGGSQTRQVAISYREATRLYLRFKNSSSTRRNSATDYTSSRVWERGAHSQRHNICRFPSPREGIRTGENISAMPGQEDERFLQVLWDIIASKYEGKDFLSSWTVSPDLYALWSCTTSITTELFADCMNESGVLQSYCSIDRNDLLFSSIGPWSSVEDIVEEGGGNPPFHPNFIQNLLLAFERGVQRETSYCRCVILPLGKRYGVIEHVSRISSEGILLVSLAAGALPFKSQLELMSLGEVKPKLYSYQRLGLFIWRNRDYLMKHPVPRDVEIAYMKWTVRALTDPSKAKVDFDSFKKAFPRDLRGATTVGNLFEL